MWTADHFVIAVGLALLHGFYGVTCSIQRQPGAAWARWAWHMAIIGVAFGLLLMLTEAVAVTSLAHDWRAAGGTDKDLLLAAGQHGVRALTDLLGWRRALPLRGRAGALRRRD